MCDFVHRKESSAWFIVKQTLEYFLFEMDFVLGRHCECLKTFHLVIGAHDALKSELG